MNIHEKVELIRSGKLHRIFNYRFGYIDSKNSLIEIDVRDLIDELYEAYIMEE